MEILILAHAQQVTLELTVKHLMLVMLIHVKMEELQLQMETYVHVLVHNFIQAKTVKYLQMLVQTIHV
jgi:hypothetical protein